MAKLQHQRHAPLSEPAVESAPRPVAVARPFLPPADALRPYLEQMDAARWYSNFGPLLTRFEERLAARHGEGARVATAVNATQAITLSLQAMSLPPGALVAMPSWTFVATAHAVVQAGLTPWFLDVDGDSGMLDPGAVAAQLHAAPGVVGAVIPVAAHGLMPNQDAWLAFRETTGVPVLIDAAAAFDCAGEADLPLCISLHATKVLGIGEGGYLASKDQRLVERVRQLSTFGFQGTRDSAFPATNAKLSELSAAMGHAALDAWPHDRLRFMRSAQLLKIGLIGLPEVSFQSGWGSDWISSVCVVTLPAGMAAAAETRLAADGVQTRRWWGAGCHDSPAFHDCPAADLPTTRRLAGATLGLPFAVDLEPVEIERIAASLRSALA